MEGMQNKKFKGFDSMLFLLGSDHDCFWMKDCIIPLDILFLDHKFNVVKIFPSCPICDTDDCKRYCSEGNYVLELPSGYCKENNVKLGDKVILSLQNL
jgi:uncharacterized membrane protein (UPF0127 family)